jgi:hypothetical protein
VTMAFSQSISILTLPSWGAAPGYDDKGLRPNGQEIRRS